MGKGHRMKLTEEEEHHLRTFLNHNFGQQFDANSLSIQTFPRAWFNREIHSKLYRGTTKTDSTSVAIRYRGSEVEHYGYVEKFWRIRSRDGEVIRVAFVSVFKPAHPVQGIPRVTNRVYQTGKVVFLESISKKVLLFPFGAQHLVLSVPPSLSK